MIEMENTLKLLELVFLTFDFIVGISYNQKPFEGVIFYLIKFDFDFLVNFHQK